MLKNGGSGRSGLFLHLHSSSKAGKWQHHDTTSLLLLSYPYNIRNCHACCSFTLLLVLVVPWVVLSHLKGSTQGMHCLAAS